MGDATAPHTPHRNADKLSGVNLYLLVTPSGLTLVWWELEATVWTPDGDVVGDENILRYPNWAIAILGEGIPRLQQLSSSPCASLTSVSDRPRPANLHPAGGGVALLVSIVSKERWWAGGTCG